MIIPLLGSFLFFILSFQQLKNQIENGFHLNLSKWETAPKTLHLYDLLKSAPLLNFLTFWPHKNLEACIRNGKNRTWSHRQILFNAALNPISIIIWLVSVSLIGKFNGLFFLGITGLLYGLGSLLQRIFGSKYSGGEWILSLPLLFFSIEVFQSKLGLFANQMTGLQEIWLWLSDGHPTVLLMSLVVGFILNLPTLVLPQVRFVQITFSSPTILILTSLLLNLHLIHPLVALHLFWGSRVAEMTSLFWKNKGETILLPWLREFALLQFVGSLIIFYLEGFAKDWFIFENIQMEFLAFLLFAGGTQLVLQMVWGHFRAQTSRSPAKI